MPCASVVYIFTALLDGICRPQGSKNADGTSPPAGGPILWQRPLMDKPATKPLAATGDTSHLSENAATEIGAMSSAIPHAGNAWALHRLLIYIYLSSVSLGTQSKAGLFRLRQRSACRCDEHNLKIRHHELHLIDHTDLSGNAMVRKRSSGDVADPSIITQFNKNFSFMESVVALATTQNGIFLVRRQV